MFDSRNSGPVTDPLGQLLDVRSAPVTFGCYEHDEIQVDRSVERNIMATNRIGWWNRHRLVRAGLGAAIVFALACVPAAQTALLTVLFSTG